MAGWDQVVPGGVTGEITMLVPKPVEFPMVTAEPLELPPRTDEAVRCFGGNLPRSVRVTMTFVQTERPPGVVVMEGVADRTDGTSVRR